MLEYLNHFKIIESLIIVIIVVFLKVMITNSLRKIRIKFGFQKTRVIIINRVITFILYSTAIVIIAF